MVAWTEKDLWGAQGSLSLEPGSGLKERFGAAVACEDCSCCNGDQAGGAQEVWLFGGVNIFEDLSDLVVIRPPPLTPDGVRED